MWDIENLISYRLKKQLQDKIKLDMPPLYGDFTWLSWGIRTLEDWAKDAKIRGVAERSKEMNAIKSTCYIFGAYNSLCRKNKTIDKKLSLFIEDLREHTSRDLPNSIRKIELEKLKRDYPFLRVLWRKLIQNDQLKIARPSEYDFILKQLSLGNPWARTRLSYLILLDELDSIEGNFFTTGSLNKNKQEAFKKKMAITRDKFKEFGEVLGIEQTPFNHHYGDRLIPKNSDQRLSIWKKIFDKENKKVSHLFTSEKDKNTNYYDLNRAH